MKIFDPFAFAVLMFVHRFCDAALTSGGDVLSCASMAREVFIVSLPFGLSLHLATYACTVCYVKIVQKFLVARRCLWQL